MGWKKLHRYIGLIIALPLAVVALSGVVLQLRNQFEGLQPKTLKLEIQQGAPFLTLEKILESLGPENVEQIIFRPKKGNISVRLHDGNEVQLHPQTGEVVKKAPRRMNFLIELHQGSWMGPFGQYGVHFLSGLGLFFLIVSGLMIYPYKRRRIP